MDQGKDRCTHNTSPEASDEFARGAHDWFYKADDTTRRSFLKRMAAALALAGVAGAGGCSSRPEDEKLVPYVNLPNGMVPGQPSAYATAMPLGGYARGVLAISREGRPIKIEGNPDHPASLGGTDVYMQASILDLYDPGRAKAPLLGGETSDWSAFSRALDRQLDRHDKDGGAGLRVLCGTITSPTQIAQMEQYKRRYPRARWHQHDPLARANTAAGMAAVFGRAVDAVHDFSKARVVVSLDADFLTEGAAAPRYARDFTSGRRVRAGQLEMNRLYVVESAMTLTGATADHRLPMRPGDIEVIARMLATACGVELPPPLPQQRERAGVRAEQDGAASQPTALTLTLSRAYAGEGTKIANWVDVVARDLKGNAGQCLVVVGESQPPSVHVIAHAINSALGNIGNTVRYIDPVAAPADESQSLAALTRDLQGDQVQTLLILGENPAYTAPADVAFASELARLSTRKNSDGSAAAFVAHLSNRYNETSSRCQWHLPETHYLEQWGDLRGFDGTASIVQPLIAPLHSSRSAIELLDHILTRDQGGGDRGGYEIVRQHWRGALGDAFDARWNDALQRGVVQGTAATSIDVSFVSTATKVVATRASEGDATTSVDALDVVFRQDPNLYDGTFAANSWLQELPRPFTKIVWGNAALIGPATMDRLGLKSDDVIRITLRGQSIEMPVAMLPGTPDGTVTLHLGYGQDTELAAGDVPAMVGTDVYKIRRSDAAWFASGARIEKLDRQQHVVMTRQHHAMADMAADLGIVGHAFLKPSAIATPQVPEQELETSNRKLVRIASLSELRENPEIIKDLGGKAEKKPLLSLFPGWDYSKGYQWGMSIDQTACIGCNACVIACQAENNIPIVGPEECDRQREMHWIRIDQYFGGSDTQNPQVASQPVTCMHCENAPCEIVCPVGATCHSVEGLNQMIYNRCVGTRYCNNNCPYKVRRFNFLDYTNYVKGSPTLEMAQNPDVTVRSRGVMEKCSYCIQRLQRTRIEAEKMRVAYSEKARQVASENERAQLKAKADALEFEMLENLQVACQQACPTQAIAFGSIIPVAGRKTAVMAAKAQPTDYVLLRELTTVPRTSYLGRITNPNPQMPGGGEA